MRNYIYFAGKMLSDFNTFITDAGVHSTPARNYDSVKVAGRNGNLLFENNKFDNVEHPYPTIVLDNFNKNFSALKSFLLSQQGYQRLSDTFYPDEFYMATFSRIDNIKQPYLEGDIGSCVLVFERKPQRYLKDGEKKTTFTSNGVLLNPTQFDALPRIRTYGSGTLTVNNISITISTQKAYLDIDCELQEVLQEDGNRDIILVNGEFIKLSKGLNNISFSGLTRVEITPRWWTL